MAVRKVDPTAPSGQESWNNMNEWCNLSAFGRDRVSLTEWDTATIPQIAQGSLFETGGSLYEVESDTSIGGSPSDGYVYILFNDTAETFSFTNTVPVWDATKYGYYDTATNYKALPFKILKSGSDYNYKKIDDVEKRIINVPERMFEVSYTADKVLTQNHTTGVSPIPAFDSILYNLNTCFNNTTRVFTAPSDGLYNFSFNAWHTVTGSNIHFYINKNSTIGYLISILSAAGVGSQVISCDKNIYLLKDDTISLDYYLSGASTIYDEVTVNPSYPTDINSNPIFSCVKIA